MSVATVLQRLTIIALGWVTV